MICSRKEDQMVGVINSILTDANMRSDRVVRDGLAQHAEAGDAWASNEQS